MFENFIQINGTSGEGELGEITAHGSIQLLYIAAKSADTFPIAVRTSSGGLVEMEVSVSGLPSRCDGSPKYLAFSGKVKYAQHIISSKYLSKTPAKLKTVQVRIYFS